MSEALVMDLLAHPDAKLEDIAMVREKVIQTRKTLEEVWRSVNKLFVGRFVTPQPHRDAPQAQATEARGSSPCRAEPIRAILAKPVGACRARETTPPPGGVWLFLHHPPSWSRMEP